MSTQTSRTSEQHISVADNHRMVEILTAPHGYASVSLLWALDTLGPDILDWDPLTINLEVQREIGRPLKGQALDRLLAGIFLVANDRFWNRAADFIRIANVLSGDTFDITTFDPADVLESTWALAEALMLAPPDVENASQILSEEVKIYLGQTLRNEGFIRPPQIMRIALGPQQPPDLYTEDDDPELAAAMWQHQDDKTREIDDIVAAELQELITTLQSLRLRHGDLATPLKKLQMTA